jgi:hypothetical protein
MRSAMSLYNTGREIPDSDRVYWTLSALLSRRFYPPLFFYGDEPSAKRLTKDWGIKFDHVDTTLIPHETRHAHPMCWSAGKIVAMRDMAERGEPFFHIDGDAFVFRKLPESITDSRIFCQCIETKIRRSSARYRRNTHYPLNELLPDLRMPNWMTKYARRDSQTVINMGIFGGTDLESIRDYCNIALKTFVHDRHNRQQFSRLHRGMPHFLGIACVTEQWSCAAFLHYKGITPTAIMNRIDSFNVNRAHEVNGFVHLFTALRRLKPYRAWAKHKLKQLRQQEIELAKAA